MIGSGGVVKGLIHQYRRHGLRFCGLIVLGFLVGLVEWAIRSILNSLFFKAERETVVAAARTSQRLAQLFPRARAGASPRARSRRCQLITAATTAWPTRRPPR